MLDRAYGRPTEKVANLNLTPSAGLTDQELHEIIVMLRAEAKGSFATEGSSPSRNQCPLYLQYQPNFARRRNYAMGHNPTFGVSVTIQIGHLHAAGNLG